VRLWDIERLSADRKRMMRTSVMVAVIREEWANVVIEQTLYVIKADVFRTRSHLPDLCPDALSVHDI